MSEAYDYLSEECHIDKGTYANIQTHHVRMLIAEVDDLKAQLKGTVTTEYHDKIVQEAMNRIARSERAHLDNIADYKQRGTTWPQMAAAAMCGRSKEALEQKGPDFMSQAAEIIEAIQFYDAVEQASEDERIAVGTDAIDRLLTACRDLELNHG